MRLLVVGRNYIRTHLMWGSHCVFTNSRHLQFKRNSFALSGLGRGEPWPNCACETLLKHYLGIQVSKSLVKTIALVLDWVVWWLLSKAKECIGTDAALRFM